MALTKLTTDLIDSTIVTSVNGSTGAVTLETGTDWQATPKTANFTAVAGEGYFVNTTSAAITVTLPSSPSNGDEINLVDYAGTADTNNITITSSDNINGASDDVFINYERGGVSIVYVDSTQGWVAYNAANETADALAESPVLIDYLVVAGGGGSNSGGGGAGGYLTNYGGIALVLYSSTNYPVTVGAGGVGATHANKTSVTSGSDSIFSIFETTGGGRSGLTDSGNPNKNGAAGGSGGGGSGDGGSSSGGSGNNPSTTPSQGNNGGSAPSNAPYPGGGGGGAGGVGGAGSGQTGGAGGLGLANSITGTSTFYAGGGGGGAAYSSSQGYPGQTGGTGGSGIGGNGGSNANGGDGTASTGSGGGGFGDYSASQSYTGGNGGSGIVILRYPNSYTVTIGSGLTGSTATDGSDKVTTFTAGTGTISFS